jgi:hypothetical protein
MDAGKRINFSSQRIRSKLHKTMKTAKNKELTPELE